MVSEGESVLTVEGREGVVDRNKIGMRVKGRGDWDEIINK